MNLFRSVENGQLICSGVLKMDSRFRSVENGQ